MRALLLLLPLLLLACSPKTTAPALNTDRVAAAYREISVGKTGLTGAALARHVALQGALEDAIFAETGDIYRHYDFPEPPAINLDAGSSWLDYTAFQGRRQEEDYRPKTASIPSGEAAEIERCLSIAVVRSRLQEAIIRFRRGLADRHPLPPLEGPPPPAGTVRLLSTGHPSDRKRDAAVKEFEARFPGRARFVTIERSADPTLFSLLGNRLTSAALVGDRLAKDITHVDQWIELLVSPDEIPLWPRRHPELPLFDAHEHAGRDSLERFTRLIDQGSASCALLAALPDDKTYGGADEANARTLEFARRRPGRILPLVVLTPRSTLEELKRHLAAGARGIKLMTGHGDYHSAAGGGPIDPPNLRAIFRHCEEASLPVLWHVNVHLYGTGFLRILRDFPRLRVVNPHLGGYLTYAPGAVRELFKAHPNLHFDFSFGANAIYLRRGLEDLSFKRDEWRRLILDYPERFLFGVDMVVTPDTSVAHATMLYRLYRALLEEERYDFDYFPARGYALLPEESHHREGLRGLHLPVEALRKIYWENAARVYGRP